MQGYHLSFTHFEAMAICIDLQATFAAGPPSAISSPSGYRVLPWSIGDAVFSGGVYSCPTGTHLLMTVAEINTRAASVPDAQLMRESFFLSFSLILGCYVLGKLVGAVLNVIKGNKDDY